MAAKPQHFLTLLDYSRATLESLLKLAIDMKKQHQKGKRDESLRGKILAMIFEKSSTRTRASFEAAMYQLGGQAICMDASTSQLGRGESYEDTARVLSGYVDGIMLRTFSQLNLEKMASASRVPVINGLSDLLHPVQVMAALQTILEVKGSLKVKVAYVGDGNNLTNTWITAAMIFGFELSVACPQGHEPSANILGKMGIKSQIENSSDPVQAVKGADVVYTDTWFSMGQKEDDAKRRLFSPYQVNDELLSRAKSGVMVLHCLPAHRDEEITSVVLDGPHSYVWQEAENRLHVQKAILKTLLA